MFCNVLFIKIFTCQNLLGPPGPPVYVALFAAPPSDAHAVRAEAIQYGNTGTYAKLLVDESAQHLVWSKMLRDKSTNLLTTTDASCHVWDYDRLCADDERVHTLLRLPGKIDVASDVVFSGEALVPCHGTIDVPARLFHLPHSTSLGEIAVAVVEAMVLLASERRTD